MYRKISRIDLLRNIKSIPIYYDLLQCGYFYGEYILPMTFYSDIFLEHSLYFKNINAMSVMSYIFLFVEYNILRLPLKHPKYIFFRNIANIRE